SGKSPITMAGRVGTPIDLDASATIDPDGDALTFSWFFYPEAATGIPTRPVVEAGLVPVGDGTPGEGGIASAPAGLREPPPRVLLDHADRARATVTPKVPASPTSSWPSRTVESRASPPTAE